MRHGLGAGGELAGQTDVQTLIPSRKVDILDPCGRSGDAGIVDQTVEPAQIGHRLADEIAQGPGIPDIYPLAQHLIGQGGQALGVDIAGGDARALGQKRLDDGAADAGGAGGHDDAVSAQIQIHLTLPL